MNGKKNTKIPESECEIDERNDKSALWSLKTSYNASYKTINKPKKQPIPQHRTSFGCYNDEKRKSADISQRKVNAMNKMK